jgi:transposase-like protein
MKLICPKCKSTSGFSKDKHSPTRWKCTPCNEYCVNEKTIDKKYDKKKE